MKIETTPYGNELESCNLAETICVRLPCCNSVRQYDAKEEKWYDLVHTHAMTLQVIKKSFKIKVRFVAALLKLKVFDKYKKSALDQWGGLHPALNVAII